LIDHTSRLKGVEPRLIAVLVVASARFHKQYPGRHIRVTSGRRNNIEQERLVKEGKSWTLNSKHLHGLAVDVCVIQKLKYVDWDLAWYRRFHDFMTDAAEEIGVILEWGGHWSKVDGCHWELPMNGNFP